MSEAPDQSPDPLEQSQELSENLLKVSQQYQEVLSRFLERNLDENIVHQTDPLNITDAISALTHAMMEQPARLLEAQMGLWRDFMGLWQNAALRAMGQEVEPFVSPEPGDRRFKSEQWQQNQIFDLIKQSYLVTARWFLKTVDEINDTLDEETQHKLDFYTKQFVDALSPSNFIMTNPEVLQATIDTKGENLINGLQNILSDLEKGRGPLDPTMVNEEAFEVGKNIATSPGKVIYQTDVMQLIQYEPATEKVFKKPLLIIPPWINKFYILDLQPKNSFIKWAVEKGYTVFVVSWVNPDTKLAQKTFEDYMDEGPLAALDAIKLATGEEKVNAIGYCIGGTLLATLLAHMGATGDDRITAATFFTTQVDFTEAGDLRVFADEKTIQALDARMGEKGYLDASTM
ncbi:MAG: class I poly(R)-hydroxyalkanoic acid synthase, partial [Alphaproteobacteria bacterium]|nr:class I poly(R)-hydroxyalkanoic acid synthase [Alphaproteobacteria bacterium]